MQSYQGETPNTPPESSRTRTLQRGHSLCLLDNLGSQDVLTLNPYICTAQDSFQRGLTDVVSLDPYEVSQLNDGRETERHKVEESPSPDGPFARRVTWKLIHISELQLLHSFLGLR
ncbi:hypothetical protein VULLAG_LOCUS10531 [Vulpes lagopus]